MPTYTHQYTSPAHSFAENVFVSSALTPNADLSDLCRCVDVALVCSTACLVIVFGMYVCAVIAGSSTERFDWNGLLAAVAAVDRLVDSSVSPIRTLSYSLQQHWAVLLLPGRHRT